MDALRRLAMDAQTCHKCLQALVEGTSPVLNLSVGGPVLFAAATPPPATSPEAASSSGKKKKRARLAAEASSAADASPDEVAQAGYWILLGTHMINRLTALMDSAKDPEMVAQLLANLCYLLARILVPIQDRALQDRALQKLLEKACANRARNLLGRAILSITVAATASLEHLTLVELDADDDMASLSLASWIPATLALDIVVRLSQACPKVYSSFLATTIPSSPTASSSSSPSPQASEAKALNFWNHSQTQLSAQALNICSVFHDDLDTICQEVSKQLTDMHKWEEPCLAALLGVELRSTATPSPPPTKRSNTRRKSSRASATAETPTADETPSASTVMSPLVSAFTNLLVLDDDKADAVKYPNAAINSMKIDGRVAAKRWGSMALAWCIQGQKRVLDALVAMLGRRLEWHATMTAFEAEVKSEGFPSAIPAIPSDVAFLALASRLVAVVCESHGHSGTRAPSGGLEAYVRIILPQSFTNSEVGKKSFGKKTPKAALPDLRDVATVVIYHLLQSHEDCLEVNHMQELEQQQLLLVNDDEEMTEDSSDDSASPSKKGTKKDKKEEEALGYVPVMRPLLEGLCRAAAGTATSTLATMAVAEQILCMDRLQKIASAFILQNLRDDARSTTAVQESPNARKDPLRRRKRPMDVPLVHYALSHLSEALDKGGSISIRTEGSTAAANNATNDSIEWIKQLSEPILAPQLCSPAPTAAAPARRRGSKSSCEPTTQTLPPCSFAGVLTSTKDDDVLCLVLRAVVASGQAIHAELPKRKQVKRGLAKAKDEPPASIGNLYSTLLGIVERCYGTEKAAPASEETSPETSAGQKKRANLGEKGSARKRRKTENGPVEATDDEREELSKRYVSSLHNDVLSLLGPLPNGVALLIFQVDVH
jgi:hypothetical protein